MGRKRTKKRKDEKRKEHSGVPTTIKRLRKRKNPKGKPSDVLKRTQAERRTRWTKA